jgi:hypothetical protein
MDYMILIYSDENFDAPAPGTPEFDEMMGGWFAFNQRLIDGGHWIGGASLQPTGPYVETKEQLGGFYLISADNLDQALELAAGIPIPVGSLEVRPVAFRPDAA